MKREVPDLSEIFLINLKLKRKYGNKVKAVQERDCIRLTGTLDSWEEIVDACSTAVSRNKNMHVVNDIELRGSTPIPERLPSIKDNAIDGKKPDVLVIGGGISGCAIARELSKWNIDVMLVEKEPDFALQASGRNDGEVHVGVDLGKGSLKQKYVLLGNRCYGDVCEELNVPFRRVGQYACFTEKWLKVPIWFYVQWRRFYDGADDSRFVTGEEIRKANKNFNPDFQFGIYNSMAGIVSPYQLTIAYAENAVQNGAEAYLNTAVLSMDVENNEIKAVHTNRGTVYPKIVINAAGVFADDIAEMAGDRFYSIHPRRGTETIQDLKSGKMIDTVASYVDVSIEALKSHSKGGGLLKTVHGNVLAGPDAVECREKEDYSTRPESIKKIYDKQRKTISKTSERDIITYFTGVRAPTFEEDFVIEWGRNCKNMYHCGGIQSPGLTSAPAFAKDIEQDVISRLQLERGGITKKADYNPRRKGIPEVKNLSPEERDALIKENPDYGVIICRCEEISKGEILDALRSPCCPPTIDAIKKRCRPGMGRCQGGFCSPLVTQIIAEERGIPLSEVRKSSAEAVQLYGETKTGGKANAEN